MPTIDHKENLLTWKVDGTHSASATTINIQSGDISVVPDPDTVGAYDVIWWDNTNHTNPSIDANAEFVRIYYKDSGNNQIHVIRNSQGEGASAKDTSGSQYLMAVVFTKRDRDDIETYKTSTYQSNTIANNWYVDEYSQLGVGTRNPSEKLDVLGGNVKITATDVKGDITASYTTVSYDVSNEDTTPTGVDFKTDGTKMYILGNSSAKLYQYSLSNAWDVTSASKDTAELDVSGDDSSPYAVRFKDDGTKVYVAGDSSDTIYQYALSTAWDVSTASSDGSFGIPSNNPRGLSFSDTGDRLFLADNGFGQLYQFSLSTAWDVSTASLDRVNTQVGEGNKIKAVTFLRSVSNSGNYAYILGENEVLYQYYIPQEYDIPRAYMQQSLDVSGVDATVTSLQWKYGNPDTLYLLGDDTDNVYQLAFSLTSGGDIIGDNKFSLVGYNQQSGSDDNVEMRAVDTSYGEMGFEVPRLELTRGRFDFQPAGAKAEIRVAGDSTDLNFYNKDIGSYYMSISTNSGAIEAVKFEFGDMGVGTTSPKHKLDVRGDVYHEGKLVGTDDLGWYILAQANGTTEDLEFVSASAPTFTVQTANTVDITNVISKGMKIRVEQSTGGTKYGWIITDPFVNGNNKTEFEVYTSKHYSIENESINNPVFSVEANPYGWPPKKLGTDPNHMGITLTLRSDQNNTVGASDAREKVPFNLTVRDEAGTTDVSNDQIQVPVNGIYRLAAYCKHVEANVGAMYSAYIRELKNGSSPFNFRSGSNSSDDGASYFNYGFPLTIDNWDLSAGDNIAVQSAVDYDDANQSATRRGSEMTLELISLK
jgi:hypothetical protein